MAPEYRSPQPQSFGHLGPFTKGLKAIVAIIRVVLTKKVNLPHIELNTTAIFNICECGIIPSVGKVHQVQENCRDYNILYNRDDSFPSLDRIPPISFFGRDLSV